MAGKNNASAFAQCCASACLLLVLRSLKSSFLLRFFALEKVCEDDFRKLRNFGSQDEIERKKEAVFFFLVLAFVSVNAPYMIHTHTHTHTHTQEERFWHGLKKWSRESPLWGNGLYENASEEAFWGWNFWRGGLFEELGNGHKSINQWTKSISKDFLQRTGGKRERIQATCWLENRWKREEGVWQKLTWVQ